MKPAAKVGLVAAGYIAAFALASAVLAIRLAQTSGPDAQASSGMYAFGDAVLFVAVFGVAALVPTGAALFFLRPYRAFWNIAAGLALIVGVTSVAAVGLFAVGRAATAQSLLGTLAAVSVLRIILAPLLAPVFLVAALFAPFRIPRLALLAAMIMEALATVYAGVVWFLPLLIERV
jgi:hypothetical protein